MKFTSIIDGKVATVKGLLHVCNSGECVNALKKKRGKLRI